MSDQPEYLVGLDLGQSQDYSALTVLERTEQYRKGKLVDPDLDERQGYYAMRYLKRWQLGTSYPAVVKETKLILSRPPLPGCRLIVDHTGVGRAVVDMLAEADLPAKLVPMTITTGHAAVRHGNGWHVAKKHLAGVLQVLLQTQRLKISDFPLRKIVERELRAFRVKVKADTGNESYEALRERDHDDIVLATALAAWVGERGTPKSQFRVLPFKRHDKEPKTTLVILSYAELATLQIDDPALLITFGSPDASAITPDHAIQKLAGVHHVRCLPESPEYYRETWTLPLAPYDKLPGELVLDKDRCRKLWKFLLQRREPTARCLVFADDGVSGLALSAARGVQKALGLPDGVLLLADPEAKAGEAPLPHVAELVKSTRHLVIA